MPNLQKPTESSKHKMAPNKTPKAAQKQSNKNKGTLLTKDDDYKFDATGSPLPCSTVAPNHFSHDPEDRDQDKGDKQNKDKQQKTNKHSTHVPALKALKTTNNENVIPSSYKYQQL